MRAHGTAMVKGLPFLQLYRVPDRFGVVDRLLNRQTCKRLKLLKNPLKVYLYHHELTQGGAPWNSNENQVVFLTRTGTVA